jgi:hypothetical protein
MKPKKSLWEVAYNAYWKDESSPFRKSKEDKEIFENVAKAVAREIRRRDKNVNQVDTSKKLNA